MDDPTARLGLYVGTVVDRSDPLHIGRVRVKIPGLVEPASAWAFPLGTVGGGGAQRGGWFVPELGATVAVFFREGDVDVPFYLTSGWSRAELPGPVEDAIPEETEVRVLETRTWRITFDDRTGEDSKLVIENKDTGDRVEFDGHTAGILVEGKSAVVVKALGVVSIEGLQVVINGRVVRPGSDPI